MRAKSILAVLAFLPLAATNTARADEPTRAQAFAQENNDAAAVVAFRRGNHAYDHHEFRAALDAFRESYRLVPSPNSRLYVARCLRELGQIPDAAAEFQATYDDARQRANTEARYEATRDAAHDELQPLLARVGRVTLQNVPAGAHVTVDGRDVAADAIAHPVFVAAGNVAVVVETSGHEPFRSTVAVAAGAEVPVAVTAPDAHPAAVAVAAPPPTAGPADQGAHQGPDRTLLIAGIGAVAVGLIGFGLETGFWLAADSQFNSLVSTCGGQVTCPGHDNAISSGRTFDTLSYVGMGIGIAGVAVGGVLLVMSMRHPSSHHVQVGFGGTSVLLRGEF